MTNFYQATKTINGKTYTAQFNGISAALSALDNSYVDGTNNTSITKLAEYIFSNVIVDPHPLSIDDFDSMDDFNAVLRFGSDVMQGKFRASADEITAKGKGKK